MSHSIHINCPPSFPHPALDLSYSSPPSPEPPLWRCGALAQSKFCTSFEGFEQSSNFGRVTKVKLGQSSEGREKAKLKKLELALFEKVKVEQVRVSRASKMLS